MTVDQRGSRPQAGRQSIHLVLHQCDERRDDHPTARQQDRRQLVADRLSGPVRKDAQNVPSRQQRRDHLPLAGTEGRMAEVLGERLLQR